MTQTIREFMYIGKSLAVEHRFEPLLTTILCETLKAVGASGGIMYLQSSKSQNIRMNPVRAFWQQNERKGLPSFYPQQNHSMHSVAYGRRKVETIDQEIWLRDFSELAPYSGPMLMVAEPLSNHSWETIGILCIFLPISERSDIRARLALVEALAGTSAIAIETQRLIDEQKRLLESFIELVAGAIDAKSPYTGAHCQRVPVITNMLAQAASKQKTGPFADFYLSEDEKEALHIASWLHDCGKVTTPEFVVDKATKLETIYNRIHEVRMRFEVLKRERQIAAQNELLSDIQRTEIQNSLQPVWKELDDDFAFVASCNIGEEVMDPKKLERLQAIAQKNWVRTMDDTLGLSAEELVRVQKSGTVALPCTETLLADRTEHLIERKNEDSIDVNNLWGFKVVEPKYLYNRGELHNLSIIRGTLTDEERYKINQHMSQTIIMLSKLPFPQHLRSIPEIAGGHHEKLNGTGYPKRLSGDQLTIQARIVAVADIFEALTARDRPYKKGKTVGEALTIMACMVRDQHIDGDLFALLLTSGVWKDYANSHLLPSQIDEVDVKTLLRIANERPHQP